MREPQPNDPFDTPTREWIAEWSPAHAELMESSDDDQVWVAAGMKHVLLYTIGRRSGEPRKTPLPYWLDEQGNHIVVASFAGAPKHPAWFHNLADKTANPTVRVRERSEVWECEARVLDGDDRETVWAQLTEDRPFYLDYQAQTDRRLPLVRLAKA